MARYNSSSPAESCNRAQLKCGFGESAILRRYTPTDFRPVGFGLALPGCGGVSGRWVCRSCWTPIYRRESCNRRSCPVCYTHWAGQGARRIAGRFSSPGAIKTFFGKRLLWGVLSPGVAFRPFTIVDYRALRADAIKVLKKQGIVGGAVCFHAYSTTDKLKAVASARGWTPWDTVRDLQRGGLSFESLVSGGWIDFSPHFHWIGYAGHVLPGSCGDWVFKNLARGRNPLNKSGSAFVRPEVVAARVYGVAAYELSHCSSFEDCGQLTQSYTWFGSRFVGSALRVSAACPNCKSVDLMRWSAAFTAFVYGTGLDGCPADKSRALRLAVVEGVMPDSPCILDGDV